MNWKTKLTIGTLLFGAIVGNSISCSGNEEESKPYEYSSLLSVQAGQYPGPIPEEPMTYEEALNLDFDEIDGFAKARVVRGKNYIELNDSTSVYDVYVYKYNKKDQLEMKKYDGWGENGLDWITKTQFFEYHEEKVRKYIGEDNWTIDYIDGPLSKITSINEYKGRGDTSFYNVDTTVFTQKYAKWRTPETVGWIYKGFIDAHTTGEKIAELSIEKFDDGTIMFDYRRFDYNAPEWNNKGRSPSKF